MRWERVMLPQAQEAEQGSEEAGGPGKRWTHTCNAIKGGRFLYLFGGFGIDNCQTNEVHVFDTVEQTWSQPTIKGMPPAPRDGHSCTNVGDNLFVFGGTDGMNPLGDLHILYTSSHTWISPITRGEVPEARQGHSAALVDIRLFIFGGYGKSPDNDDEVYYNDLFILNTETFAWKKAMTTGMPPSPRHTHSCSTWKNKMIVIGGEDGHDNYLSDVHILDADTLMWKELNTTGHMLPPRAGYLTITFGKILFVYGGYTEAQKLYDDLYMLDVESTIWSKLTTTGAGPSARFSMAGVCLDPVRSGVLAFVGGCNRSLEALDDIYYLHTGLTGEHEQRLEKLPSRKKLKLKCQEQNLTLGQDKALVQLGVSSSSNQPVPLSIYGQPGAQSNPHKQLVPVHGKHIFEAGLTENFGDRYTIETVIDGKPLHGVLFSSKPSTLPIPPSSSSSGKRSYGDSSAGASNGDHNCESKADAMQGEEAFSQKAHAEYAGPFPVSDVLQPFDGSDLESTSQFQHDQMDEAPNLNVEVPKQSVSPSTKDSNVISQNNHAYERDDLAKSE
ncbi:hypothetical protein ACJRO7_009802 [Eucalyptus globulus]|uniref:Uncharacterized protein n=1 Tax=Eucalyptus globulus TaxID=34317 RepID=A0ABD3LFF7_EUCGL